MSNEFIVQSIITIMATAIVGLVAWLGKSKIDRIDADLKTLKDDMDEFKDNYLDRFEKVNKNINSSKEQILEKFHTLEMSLKK